jgi:hypothetical protein
MRIYLLNAVNHLYSKNKIIDLIPIKGWQDKYFNPLGKEPIIYFKEYIEHYI